MFKRCFAAYDVLKIAYDLGCCYIQNFLFNYNCSLCHISQKYGRKQLLEQLCGENMERESERERDRKKNMDGCGRPTTPLTGSNKKYVVLRSRATREFCGDYHVLIGNLDSQHEVA